MITSKYLYQRNIISKDVEGKTRITENSFSLKSNIMNIQLIKQKTSRVYSFHCMYILTKNVSILCLQNTSEFKQTFYVISKRENIKCTQIFERWLIENTYTIVFSMYFNPLYSRYSIAD